jgi:RNA polymerase sigma-70 factor (ECF subfamily)
VSDSGKSTPEAVRKALDQLFRREAGQLVASLVRTLGPGRLDDAECAVQDAVLDAMRAWPIDGVPDNPGAWLTTAARRRALDRVRRSRVGSAKVDQLGEQLAVEGKDVVGAAQDEHPMEAALRLSGDLPDDRLRLLFICCHPEVPADAHLPLALKTLFGLTTREIGAIFLAAEETIAQRLVRAKRRIAELGLAFELPPPSELPARRSSVLATLYLAFTEGYCAHGGDLLVRKDICAEAIRLGQTLAAHWCDPEAHALVAMMCFHASRFPARVDDAGDLLLLEHQDRRRWDHDLIALGAEHLTAAMGAATLSRYHFEAGIAACHAFAPSWSETDWGAIVGYYDGLLAKYPSPTAALGRACAVAMADGEAAGLRELAPLKKDERMKSYHLLFAVEGNLLSKLGRNDAARKAYERALALEPNAPERRMVMRKLTELG